MRLFEMLEIEKGVTAVIGSGGKTALLHVLAEELPDRVILCTSTRMYPSDVFLTLISPEKEEIKSALKTHRVIGIGEPAEDGKIKSPNLPFSALSEMADFVLVEADGAKQLPLKAHEAHEPVIPDNANQTICVVGVSGFGKPICDTAHRSERFAELAEVKTDALATPEMTAKVIATEGLADRVFVNQTETKESLLQAKTLAKDLEIPVVVGSLWNGTYEKIN